MSALATAGQADGAAPRASLRIRVSSIRRIVLWTFIACSCVAIIEPSPYEFMFAVAVAAYASRGLLFDRAMAPMIVLLAMLNAGGLLSLVPWVGERESVTFVAISVYVAITAVFFAGLIAKNPIERLRTIRSAYVLAGVIA